MGVTKCPAEHVNVWNPGVKNHCRRNFNYRCFIKGDILWRFRPNFYLSIPVKHHTKVIVMDSWMRIHANKSPAHWLDSRMEEACLPLLPFVLPPARDNDKIMKCFKSNYLVSEPVLGDPTVKSEILIKDTHSAGFKDSGFDFTLSEKNQPVEEPWLLQSSIHLHHAAHSSPTNGDRTLQHVDGQSLETKFLDQSTIKGQHYSKSHNRILPLLDSYSVERNSNKQPMFTVEHYSKSEDTSSTIDSGCDIVKAPSMRNQPVEEPWLLESCPFEGSSVEAFSEDVIVEEDATNSKVTNQEHSVQLHPETEKLLPVEETIAISQKDSVPTIILINSSVCTMQRIAVLEDEELVELLLEPVKNNVQCDSVYLGVVTKLVPHMGGAFVNIGSSRPSLMDIKHNREPFIFPPFRHPKEKEVNGSAFTVPAEQLGADGIQTTSHDVEPTDEIDDHAIDDDPDQYLHDEYAEHDIEDDEFDTEALKENVNGSVSGHGEAEVNYDGFLDQFDRNSHNIEGCSDSAPSHLQVMRKDCEDALAGKNKWGQVRKGTKVVVQVVKEGLGTKGPTLTAYPKLRSRFWVLSTCCNTIGISKKITGVERTRLRVIAKTLQPHGFGLTVRTVATSHSLDELRKDLEGLLLTWKEIIEHAKSAALAADEGVEGAIPVILHRAMGQTLCVVQDYFNEKVNSMVVDSPRTYHEVTNYLQEIAPDLCDRVELYNRRTPLFDEYNIEEEISNMLSKRVPLANGGYLVIEQTEALVSIDVNGGQCMLGQGTSQENAILNVNLAAAKQIARELRLRDIGGIIVVDFIDMVDDANKRLVYEEVTKAVERDRSTVKVSELSRHGLMEITRKRVRPSVTFMITERCTCCHATGRVEALETSFSKIEREICRLLAMNQKADPEDPKSWPRFILRVDRYMCNYLTSGKRTRLAVLSSSLKVWILLKVARGFTRGAFEMKPLTSDKDYNSQHQVAINMLRPMEIGPSTPSGKVTVIPVKKWKSGRK